MCSLATSLSAYTLSCLRSHCRLALGNFLRLISSFLSYFANIRCFTCKSHLPSMQIQSSTFGLSQSSVSVWMLLVSRLSWHWDHQSCLAWWHCWSQKKDTPRCHSCYPRRQSRSRFDLECLAKDTGPCTRAWQVTPPQLGLEQRYMIWRHLCWWGSC